MRRPLRLVWGGPLLTTLLVLLAAALPSQAAPSMPGKVQLSFTSELVSLRDSVQGAQRFQTWDTTMPLDGAPGTPALPQLVQWIGVPSDDSPTPTIELGDPQPLPTLVAPLEPVPTEIAIKIRRDILPESTYKDYRMDAALYAQAGWYPAEPVTFSAPMTLRGQRVVRVTFTPVQVNLATGAARWFPSAEVGLEWPDAALPTANTLSTDTYFDPLLDRTLTNFEQARAWRPALSPTPERGELPSTGRWMLVATGEGLYRVSLQALAAQGVDISDPNRLALFHGPTDPALEQEQAIWIDGDWLYFVNTHEATRWSRQTAYRLEVLSTGSGRRMAELPSPATQPTTVASVPYTLKLEENKLYEGRSTLADAPDHWYWKRLLVLTNTVNSELEFAFNLPAIVTDAPTPATLTMTASPESGACHAVRLYLGGDGTPIAQQGGMTCVWQGTTPFNQVASIPHNRLRATGNTLRIEQRYIDTVDSLFINRLAVRYQHHLLTTNGGLLFDDAARTTGTNFQVGGQVQLFLPLVTRGAASSTERAPAAPPARAPTVEESFLAFEISTPAAPRHITGGRMDGGRFTFGRPNPSSERYLVARQDQVRAAQIVTLPASTLRSDLSQTDYLIIVPQAFEAETASLRALRLSQGYTVRTVTTELIYKEFGSGAMDPQAIREFLKFAYRNYRDPQGNNAPAFAVLVGDGTYDPLDFLSTGKRTWIPPGLADADEEIGETAADHVFVVALDPDDTPESDPLPDMHIGRLPVNSNSEAQAMVQKIVAYESSAPTGDWRRRTLLTTDDQPSATQCDPAGCFYALSDSSATHLPSWMQVRKVYLRGPGTTYTTGEATRDGIANEMNQGAAIVQYIGHGARNQWAAPAIWSVRRSDNSNDLSRLEANPRQPLSLPWTCWEGYFISPTEESISEQMVRLPDRGTIASFAPTGLDVATGHDRLTLGFYDTLFNQGTGQVAETQLGPLTFAAKLNVAGTSYERLLYTYLLLGDPALHLHIE